MSDGIIVIGGGGHAKSVIDCIESSGFRVAGILDDGMNIGETVLGVPVVGKIADYLLFRDNRFIIAIGDNRVRHRIADSLNAEWYSAIHPCAVISPYAKIGKGVVVMANAVINAGAVVGAHCIINTSAVVEHDDRIADFVHISPSAALGGSVTIGEWTHIGIGAVVKNNVKLCGGCTVGAGAVVVKDIVEEGVYVGIPAHKK